MKRTGKRAPKAYANREFLHSPQARPLRLLAEFLEPQSRFERYGVENTIVFFGSARTVSAEEAARLQEEAEKRLAVEGATPAVQAALARARRATRMAKYYEDAVEVASRLTAWSKSLHGAGPSFVICSGGGPGIMEAANYGASLAGGRSVGLNISIPFEQAPNAYISPELNFEFHYFFMRKFWFVYLAKALVVFPGGFGTFDELMEVITLLQTGKVSKRLPIVVYGTEYWKKVLNFDVMVEWGTISPQDLDLLHFSDSPDDAVSYLQKELSDAYVANGGSLRRASK